MSSERSQSDRARAIRAKRQALREEGRCTQCTVRLTPENSEQGRLNCTKCIKRMAATSRRSRQKRAEELETLRRMRAGGTGTEPAAAAPGYQYVVKLPARKTIKRTRGATSAEIHWATLKGHYLTELLRTKGESMQAQRALCEMAAVEHGVDPLKSVSLVTRKAATRA